MTGRYAPLDAAVARLKDPAYTGANRCLPCAAVNVAAAAGLSTVALYAGGPLVAAGVFAAGLAVVYARGYLVPGTPELTKRHLPDRALRWFDKAPDGSALDGVDPEAYLLGTGAFAVEDDELVPRAWFEDALAAGVRDLHSDGELAAGLAAVLGLGPERVTVEPLSTGYRALVGGQPAGSWESRVALATDVAAHRVFAGRVAGWRRLSVDARASLLGALRLCLTTCPACDGDVELETDLVESCCRSYEVLAAHCVACDARLFEVDAGLAGAFEGDEADAEPV
jgi:hypothetical protein